MTSRMRRAASVDRLSKSARVGSLATAAFKCDLVGFPYCCTKHYNTYRGWPYYLDPADYPRLHRYSHAGLRYWPDYWPYNSYYYEYYHQRRPQYYHGGEDDYYGDYLRGYAEGMRKYGDKRKRSTSVHDLTSSAVPAPASAYASDRYPHYYWWYCKPYYYRRYL